jgi:hypothetical protein
MKLKLLFNFIFFSTFLPVRFDIYYYDCYLYLFEIIYEIEISFFNSIFLQLFHILDLVFKKKLKNLFSNLFFIA